MRKVFISVKGIYYQVLPHHVYNSIAFVPCSTYRCCLHKHAFVRACIQVEVEGQKITWLTPHGMQQVLPDDDVVYDVLLTFLEFYEVIF